MSHPARIWLVVYPTGEKHFVDKEFIEGAAEWAKGSNVAVFEYRLDHTVHLPRIANACATCSKLKHDPIHSPGRFTGVSGGHPFKAAS